MAQNAKNTELASAARKALDQSNLDKRSLAYRIASATLEIFDSVQPFEQSRLTVAFELTIAWLDREEQCRTNAHALARWHLGKAFEQARQHIGALHQEVLAEERALVSV